MCGPGPREGAAKGNVWAVAPSVRQLQELDWHEARPAAQLALLPTVWHTRWLTQGSLRCKTDKGRRACEESHLFERRGAL